MMAKDRYGVIYLITNNINNKKYIGQTIQPLKNRIQQHLSKSRDKSTNTPLHNSIRKYGWCNCSVVIIDYAYSEDELNDKEIYYIEKYNTINEGYNLTLGGGGTTGFAAVITENKVVKAKEMIRDTYYTFREISDILDININTLFSIYYGYSWSHVKVNGFEPRMERLENPNKIKKEKIKKSDKILDDDIVYKIKLDMVNGLSDKDISEKYNISKYVVSKISLGKTYRYVHVEGFNPSRKDSITGSKNPMSKLTEEDVIEIRNMIIEGYKNKDIANKFNVKPNLISRIRNGKRWSHVHVDMKEGDSSVKMEISV